MSDDTTSTTDATDGSGTDSDALAASSTYKIRGKFDDTSGAGVLGINEANSGTPVGVEGAVPNNTGGYGLSTPHDARVQGTLATTGEWQVDVDTDLGLRLTSSGTIGSNRFKGSGSLVVGHLNELKADVKGASIAGGGYLDDDNNDKSPNRVNDHYGTISGGHSNTVGNDNSDLLDAFAATIGGGIGNTATGSTSTVAGGSNNMATADEATVGGGTNNEASGTYATVSGGRGNAATAKDSFAAGREASADHEGAFVWSDSGSATFSSTGADQFLVQAVGGVGINTDSPASALDVDGTATVGSDLEVSGTVRRDAMTKLYFTSAVSLANGTEATLGFDGVSIDEPLAWSTSNEEYTCPANGHYEVTLNVKFAASPLSEDIKVTARIKESSASSPLGRWIDNGSSGEYFRRSYSTTLTGLTAGDVLTFTLEQSSNGSKNLLIDTLGTSVSIRYLGTGTS